jgi:hypothetical protein
MPNRVNTKAEAQRNSAIGSVGAPPDPVSCAGEQAQVQVSAINTACPTGYGKSYWSYRSATTGGSTKLCLTRVYHANYCISAGSPATRSPSP